MRIKSFPSIFLIVFSLLAAPVMAEDTNLSFEEIRLLAEQGDAQAQSILGLRYALGEGVPQDHKEAVRWYLKAAEQGLARAQYNLGAMYASGKEGVPQDHKEAVRWYRKAAEQDYIDAQYNLALIYIRGEEGVPQDHKAAAKWFSKAAEQGDAESQFNLGLIFLKDKDYEEAAKWFRKAAEQGFAKAQHNLGTMYYNGNGVPQDDREAYAWIDLAARQGAEIAKTERDFLTKELNPVTLSEAKKLSKEHFKKYVEPFQ